ncbi:MAG: hypothetical protein ACRDZT_08805 [Acidimicrobiales bacterium]
MDFLSAEFPATSSDMSSASATAWATFENTISATDFNACMRRQGFIQAWQLAPAHPPPPQDNEHFPDVTRLEAGQWLVSGTPTVGDMPPPGTISASEATAVKDAQKTCQKSNPFAPLWNAEAPLSALYGQDLDQIYADPRVTGAWANSFVPCVRKSGINISSYQGWQQYLSQLQVAQHGALPDAALSRTYGICVASVAKVMDHLRLQARQKLFDTHALQLQQIAAIATQLVRKLSDEMPAAS